MTDCCHPSAEAPCDLSRSPVKTQSVAVLKTRAVSAASPYSVGAVHRIPVDDRFRSLLPEAEAVAGPSSFPPLFLLKNALLC